MDKIHYNYDKNKININLLCLLKITKKYNIPECLGKHIFYYLYELTEYDYINIHNNGGSPYIIYYCTNKFNKPIYIFDNEYILDKVSNKKWETFTKKINDYHQIINIIYVSLFAILSGEINTFFMKTIEKLDYILINILHANSSLSIRGEMDAVDFEKVYYYIGEFLNIIHDKNKFYYEYILFFNEYSYKFNKKQIIFIKQKISYINNIFDDFLKTIVCPKLIKKLYNVELFIGNDLQNIPSRIYTKNNQPRIADEYEDGNIKHFFCNGNSIIFLNKNKKKYTYTILGGSSCIREIVISDKIINFVSPLGNSDVPYHYALSEKNIYFTADRFQIININNFINFLKNNYSVKLCHLNLNKNTICKYDFSWHFYKYEESHNIEYIKDYKSIYDNEN